MSSKLTHTHKTSVLWKTLLENEKDAIEREKIVANNVCEKHLFQEYVKISQNSNKMNPMKKWEKNLKKTLY